MESGCKIRFVKVEVRIAQILDAGYWIGDVGFFGSVNILNV